MSPRPGREVEGRRTVSAGQVVVVTLLSLLIASLLNADSLVETIQGQTFGTERSVELAIAQPIRTVSHWTGLDLPRKLIDKAVADYDAPSAAPKAAPTRDAPPPPGPTTTTIPALRVPTVAQPLKVWLAGDSLMGNIAAAFINKTGADALISASQDYQIGTGLARPDVYDWPAAISHEIATVNPDVIVVIFGANDDQDMVVGSTRYVLDSAAWQQEYARRVNQVLDIAANGTRQVIWLSVPAVRRPRLNQTKDLINNIVQTAAAQHPHVTYFDTGALLDGPGNSFTTYLNNASGQAVAVRDTDGIHLTLDGANLLTPVILADIDQLWHLPAS